MSKNVFVDFHVLQTVPPSCLNRDDTGSPKTAIYGGVLRARVSSQCWKRAIREMFKDHFDEADLGVRTKNIVDMIAKEISARDASKAEHARELAEKIINAAGVIKAGKITNAADVTKEDSKTKVKALFFISKKQVKNLVDLILDPAFDIIKDKKQLQATLKQGLSVDIALFGRMVATDPSLNAEASAQVAHSISTHKVENEYDYFTAVDDLQPEDNAGAGMIGTVEYNSATLYRYATVAAHDLYEQLVRDDTALAKTINEFARAFITSMPTGKQNTFANRTLPDAVLVTIRTDQPVNLVGAFEVPVKAVDENGTDIGFVKESARQLIMQFNKTTDFCEPPKKAYAIGELLAEIGSRETLDSLIKNLGAEVAGLCAEG